MSDERPAKLSPKYADRRRGREQNSELAAELARVRVDAARLAAGLPPADTPKKRVKPRAARRRTPANRSGTVPDELTVVERIDAARTTIRSLTLLLQAVDAGDVDATPLEVARIQGAIDALGAMVGRAAGEVS